MSTIMLATAGQRIQKQVQLSSAGAEFTSAQHKASQRSILHVLPYIQLQVRPMHFRAHLCTCIEQSRAGVIANVLLDANANL